MNKIPIRSMVKAGEGNTLVMCDLSQAETWIVAYLSGEEKMKNSLKYGDIHTDTAANAVFQCTVEAVTKVMRYTGKRTNHATSYGMSADRFVQVVNKESDQPPYLVITLEQAKIYQSRWYGYYYKVKEWQGDIRRQLRSNRTLSTPYGRVRMFYGNLPYENCETDKAAYSFIPQSTVADHFNGATCPEYPYHGGLLEFYETYIKGSDDWSIVNQSHDSAIVEVPLCAAEECGRLLMDCLHRPLIINGEEFWIPVDCEIGPVWGEMKHFKTISKYKEN